MDLSDLLELSKGLSKIGAKIFESLWFKLRTSKSPFSFLDKHGSGALAEHQLALRLHPHALLLIFLLKACGEIMHIIRKTSFKNTELMQRHNYRADLRASGGAFLLP